MLESKVEIPLYKTSYMPSFSLNHLSSSEFEEFCFELLNEVGFVNVKWRKGTGLNSSPSDKGRDIECEKVITDSVDGSIHIERWFVECKHYQKGVPPDKIMGALTWASAERPDWLLLITSNFLSNPTKENLKSYEKNNKPNFRIRHWEKPDIERLTISKVNLLRKYKIPSDFSYLSIIHPSHLLYIRRLNFNSLNYFFSTVEKLDSNIIEGILSWVYVLIIKPRQRPAMTGNEKLQDLYIDEVSYSAFKKKCYDLANVMDQSLLVFLVVNYCLQNTLSISDTTSVQDRKDANNSSINFIESMNKKSKEEIIEIHQAYRAAGIDFPKDFLLNKSEIEKHTKALREMNESLLKRTRDNYKTYLYFCENVIGKLLEEKLFR